MPETRQCINLLPLRSEVTPAYYEITLSCLNQEGLIETHQITYKHTSVFCCSDISDYFRIYCTQFKIPVTTYGTGVLILSPLYGKNITVLTNELWKREY